MKYLTQFVVTHSYLHGVYIMRKTPKNRNTEFPPSAAAAERLADYKGEGQPLGKRKSFILKQSGI